MGGACFGWSDPPVIKCKIISTFLNIESLVIHPSSGSVLLSLVLLSRGLQEKKILA